MAFRDEKRLWGVGGYKRNFQRPVAERLSVCVCACVQNSKSPLDRGTSETIGEECVEVLPLLSTQLYSIALFYLYLYLYSTFYSVRTSRHPYLPNICSTPYSTFTLPWRPCKMTTDDCARIRKCKGIGVQKEIRTCRTRQPRRS